MQVFEPKKIGIIADSHGKPDTIINAIKYLKNNECDKIIHLGDICDTLFPETCDSCIHTLLENDILAVKGNNDHMLQLNQIGNLQSPVSEKSILYLKSLVPVMDFGIAWFAHSLPYYDEMGIACITRALGKNEISKFFSAPEKKILFRGHGHTPEMIWEKDGHYYKQLFSANQEIHLDSFVPCIVTCGALTRGLCMIWDTENQTLKSISITRK